MHTAAGMSARGLLCLNMHGDHHAFCLLVWLKTSLYACGLGSCSPHCSCLAWTAGAGIYTATCFGVSLLWLTCMQGTASPCQSPMSPRCWACCCCQVHVVTATAAGCCAFRCISHLARMKHKFMCHGRQWGQSKYMHVAATALCSFSLYMSHACKHAMA